MTAPVLDDPAMPQPDRRAAFALLFGSLVCVGLGQSLLFSVLPPLGRQMGLAEWQVGAVFALSGFLWFLMSPYWGRKSDVWGRKPVVLLGIVAYGVSMSLFILAAEAGLAGWLPLAVAFPLMVAGRGLFGLIGSGSFPAAQAYVADRTTRAERTRNIALISASFGFGVILGPGLGALLAGIQLLAPLYAVAGIAFLGALLVWLFLPENRPPKGHQARRRMKASDRRILPFLVTGVVLSVCQASAMQTAGFYLMDLLGLTAQATVRDVGIALTASAAAALFVQVVAIRVLDLRPRILLRFGAVIALAGYVVFVGADAYWPVVLALVLHGIGLGMLRPGLQAAASLAVGYDEQGATAGLISATGPVGSVTSPFIIMPLYHAFHEGPYVMNGVLMASLLAYILVNPRIRAALARAHV